MKCLSKDRNDKCCRFAVITDTRFCKNHQYMNDYTDEMLTQTTLCSGCKKMYYMDGDTKTCDNCKTRTKAVRVITRENVVLCAKDKCKFKRSMENKYCNLHQLQVFIDDTKEAGKKLCYNHIRGCREQLDESYRFSKCEECLGIERNKDRNRRNKIKIDNEILKDKNEKHIEKGCTSCCKILPIEQFKSVLHPEIETLNCLNCRENNTRQDLNRDKEHRNELARINDSKPDRIEIKKQWREDNYEKVAEYWMNSRQHKIERVGIDEYLNDNAEFAQKWRDNNPDKMIEFNDTRRNSYDNQYNVYKTSADTKQLEFSISFDDYKNVVKNPCHYCGVIQNRGSECFNGIDRENNDVGYVLDNCVSCCKMCNYMKKSLSKNVFVKRVEHILSYNTIVDNGSLSSELFGDHKCTYNDYIRSANRRGKEFTISEEEFHLVTSKECYICGKNNTDTHRNGIDRYANDIGYIIENCRACCGECNYMKREYSYTDLFNKFKDIYEHNNNKPQNDAVPQALKTSLNNISMVLSNKKTQEQLKDERRIKKQKQREALRTKYGDEEYKKIRAKEIATSRANKMKI